MKYTLFLLSFFLHLNSNAQLFEFEKIIKSSFEQAPKSFYENGNIINAQFDIKNQLIIIDRYIGNIPQKKYIERTDYIKVASNFEFKGFCTSDNQLVLLFFDKLLLYDKAGGKYQLMDSFNTKFNKLHSFDGRYFVLSNYYNHMNSAVKDIEFNGYKIIKNKLVKTWEYNEEYPYIYYSHLAGNFLDINNKNEFIVCYPKSNHINIFKENGNKTKLNGLIVGEIDSIIESENIKNFDKNDLSLKQKIYTLKKNDSIGLRIQNVKYIDANTFLITKSNSMMNHDFVFIDIWQRIGISDSFHLINYNIKNRIGFHQDPENKNFKILLPLSNSCPFHVFQNNISFWEVYIPQKLTKSKSLSEAQKKLEKHYTKRKIIYGLYLFKINFNMTNE